MKTDAFEERSDTMVLTLTLYTGVIDAHPAELTSAAGLHVLDASNTCKSNTGEKADRVHTTHVNLIIVARPPVYEYIYQVHEMIEIPYF